MAWAGMWLNSWRIHRKVFGNFIEWCIWILNIIPVSPKITVLFQCLIVWLNEKSRHLFSFEYLKNNLIMKTKQRRKNCYHFIPSNLFLLGKRAMSNCTPSDDRSRSTAARIPDNLCSCQWYRHSIHPVWHNQRPIWQTFAHPIPCD